MYVVLLKLYKVLCQVSDSLEGCLLAYKDEAQLSEIQQQRVNAVLSSCLESPMYLY